MALLDKKSKLDLKQLQCDDLKSCVYVGN